MIDLNGKTVFVTGANSMIGRSICTNLKGRFEKINIINPKKTDCNLLFDDSIRDVFGHYEIDYVIHAAGFNGGIEYNRLYPADIFYQTTQMGLNILNECAESKVKKVVSIISSCAYPDLADDELREEKFWSGASNPTVECHGYAKRFLDAYSRQISKQYPDTLAVSVVLNNSYGPHDSFDPKKTKVVGGMIKRFVDARNENLPKVECWGSGSPLREFVYSADAGKLIVDALERYDDPNLPLNLSTGIEVTIKELAETTAELVGYQGDIVWDTSKADGQLRKKLNTDRMFEIMYKEEQPVWTSLKKGLKQTIDWYENEYTRNTSLPKT